MKTAKAIKLQLQAKRRRALAPEYDPIRRDFELGLADRLEQEAAELLTPPQTLCKGLGGEIVPTAEDGLPGLQSALQEPNMLSAEASKQRVKMLERADVLELGVETAQDARAVGSTQKMLCHQLAAAHHRIMALLAEAERSPDHEVTVKKTRAAARMMTAYCQAALTLQRLQTGTSQVLQVQNVQVNAQAVVGLEVKSK